MPAPQGPPQGGPPQGAPPQGQPQGAGGGGVVGLIQNVGEALDHIKTAVAQAQGIPPEAKQMIEQISQAYGQFVDMVSGPGGGDESEGAGQGQTVPPEAAGNKGAVPSM